MASPRNQLLEAEKNSRPVSIVWTYNEQIKSLFDRTLLRPEQRRLVVRMPVSAFVLLLDKKLRSTLSIFIHIIFVKKG